MKKNINAVKYVFDEFFKKRNLTSYEEFIAEDISVYCPESWQQIHVSLVTNRNDAKKIELEYAKAFHMTNVEIDEIFSHTQKVFVRWNAKGIHTGDFFNLYATQRQIALEGQTLYHFDEEGRVSKVWQSWDMLGLLKQISAAPIKTLIELSEREKSCLRYLLEGKTAKETAILLHLSHRTIEYYFENLKDKLNCMTKRELLKIARLFEGQNLF